MANGKFINVSEKPFQNGCKFSLSTELVTFLDILEMESGKQYDGMKMIQTLFEENILPRRGYNILKQMYENGESFIKILAKLSRYCSYASLMNALYACNFTDLAQKMRRRRNESVMIVDVTHDMIGKVEGNHSAALAMYGNLKSNIDNCTFANMSEFLRTKTELVINELENLNPTSTRRRACLLDKLLVLKCTSVEITTDLRARFEALSQIETDQNLLVLICVKAALHSKEAATFALQ